MRFVTDNPGGEAIPEEVACAIPPFVEGLRVEAVASVHAH